MSFASVTVPQVWPSRKLNHRQNDVPNRRFTEIIVANRTTEIFTGKGGAGELAVLEECPALAGGSGVSLTAAKPTVERSLQREFH